MNGESANPSRQRKDAHKQRKTGTRRKCAAAGGALLLACAAVIAQAPASMAAANSATAAAATSVATGSTPGSAIGPEDIVSALSKGYEAYKWYEQCQKNMQGGHSCFDDPTEIQFQNLSNQISALSDQLSQTETHLDADIGAVSNRMRKEDLTNAYRGLGSDLSDMRIVAAKSTDYQKCMVALDQTSHQTGSEPDKVGTCTLTLANGNPETDPATGKPEQFRMATTRDFQRGPEQRLYDATVRASWGNPANPTDKAAVANAFLHKGERIQLAMAGSAANQDGGLLPTAFHYTVEGGYLDDTGEQVVAPDFVPTYIAGATVNQVNAFNQYFVGLQTEFWTGLTTSMQLVQQGSPFGSQLGSGAGDDDWAGTVKDTAINGIANEPQQGLRAQSADWSLPIYDQAHPAAVSSSSVADPRTSFVVPGSAHRADGTYVFQTTRTTRVTTDGAHSTPAPTDPATTGAIPSKTDVDVFADRLVAQGYKYSSLQTKYDAALPPIMWTKMGDSTERILLRGTSDNPSNRDDWAKDPSGAPNQTFVTTSWPADARSKGYQAPGRLLGASQVFPTACYAPVHLWDSRPNIYEVANYAKNDGPAWPNWIREHTPDGVLPPWGYQMDTKHTVNNIQGGSTIWWQYGLNGEDLYNNMNPSAAVPVYDFLWSYQGKAGFPDGSELPRYSGTGGGFYLRCGGVDHAADSGGFEKAAATDTVLWTPIKGTPAAVGGWANLIH